MHLDCAELLLILNTCHLRVEFDLVFPQEYAQRKETSSDEISSQLIQITVEALNLEHSFLKISRERSYQKRQIFLASSETVIEFCFGSTSRKFVVTLYIICLNRLSPIILPNTAIRNCMLQLFKSKDIFKELNLKVS